MLGRVEPGIKREAISRPLGLSFNLPLEECLKGLDERSNELNLMTRSNHFFMLGKEIRRTVVKDQATSVFAILAGQEV